MNLSALRLFGVFLFTILSVSNTWPAPANLILALTHVTVIEGNGGPPQPDMTVVISGERISDIFPSEQSRRLTWNIKARPGSLPSLRKIQVST
jgi:hypothetical protein